MGGGRRRPPGSPACLQHALLPRLYMRRNQSDLHAARHFPTALPPSNPSNPSAHPLAHTITHACHPRLPSSANELATLAFYVACGIKFRPLAAGSNPYFALEADEIEMAP